jgi:hypothetical protein
MADRALGARRGVAVNGREPAAHRIHRTSPQPGHTSALLHRRGPSDKSMHSDRRHRSMLSLGSMTWIGVDRAANRLSGSLLVASVVTDRSSAAWAALLDTHAAEARLGPFADGVGGRS